MVNYTIHTKDKMGLLWIGPYHLHSLQTYDLGSLLLPPAVSYERKRRICYCDKVTRDMIVRYVGIEFSNVELLH